MRPSAKSKIVSDAIARGKKYSRRKPSQNSGSVFLRQPLLNWREPKNMDIFSKRNLLVLVAPCFKFKTEEEAVAWRTIPHLAWRLTSIPKNIGAYLAFS